MKYNIIDLKNGIEKLAEGLGQVCVMEVCGTHTSSIRRYGIQELLPDNIRLVSGPGCPVCVTAQKDIAAALCIASEKDVIFTCFGDMMRVPCGEKSLYSLYESGRDIRIVISPMDALQIAQDNQKKRVVYFGIGFETTAPLSAALIEAADDRNINNLSVLSAHKTMPQAIRQLLKDKGGIDALLCPGHVAAITGADAFSFVAQELMLPAAVAGFEAQDIMTALFFIVDMLRRKEPKCVNTYPRAVTKGGNRDALSLLYQVFEPCDALWRGLGEIPGSGLKIKERYDKFDAAHHFDICITDIQEAKDCICSRVLCGKSIPTDCVNFGKACTPERPLGACMVSSEGSCAAYYRYKGEDNICKTK